MTTKTSKFETSQWMNLSEDSTGKKENKWSLILQIVDSLPQEES